MKKDRQMKFKNQEILDKFFTHKKKTGEVRKCRVCGCTDDDCSQCIEKTGKPCFWVDHDLCSACYAEELRAIDRRMVDNG